VSAAAHSQNFYLQKKLPLCQHLALQRRFCLYYVRLVTDNRRPCLQLSFGHKKILRLPLSGALNLCVALLLMALAAAQLFAQQIYEVRPGDTLSRIAAIHGVTIAELSEHNGITDPTRLRIGQKLRIPPSGQTERQPQSDSASSPLRDYYTVVTGDTIYGIARKLQISPAELMKANNLDTSSVLKIGQRLQVPVGGRAARGSSDSGHQPPTTEPPAPAPTPSPAPTQQTSEREQQQQPQRTNRPLEHRVVAGDTLSGIAARYGVSASAIAAANRISVNSILRIGQVLRIPASESIVEEIRATPLPQDRETSPTRQPAQPREASQSRQTVHTPETQIITHHTVQPGEDITTIAEQYGLTVEQLRDWNNLRPGQFLRVGQRLRLTPPGAAAAAPEEVAPEPAQTRPEQRTPTAARVSDRTRAAQPAAESRPEDTQESPTAQRPRRETSEPAYVYIRPVKAEIDRPRIKRGRWRYVVIHHSETTSGNAAIFDRFHRNVRKWENGLAYHFVIGNGRGSGDGQIEVGQRWKDQLHGGHLRSAALNEISIGICLVGSYNVERPTARQIAATIELVQYLRRLCGNPRLEFTIHRRINPTPTDCPGKLFPERTMFQRLR